MRKSLAEKRLTMQEAALKRDLSMHTHDLIFQHMAKYKEVNETAEAEAEKITAIINSSKTEAEILEKLKELE